MQINFLNPVIDACVNVMDAMAELEIATGKPTLRDPQDTEKGGTVTGLICMRSSTRVASLAIIFSEEVLQSMSLRIRPNDLHYNQFLAFDLVGEISNMIIGGAKALLLKQGYNFDITLPTVIRGHDYLIAHQTHAPIFRIPLTSDIGIFYIEASFEGPALTKEEKRNKYSGYDEVQVSTLELF
ncbi:MAG: chemotaxis protein CheX [Psychrosphaera sp.]|nr:chemotaxis protein CheX [Psychrosphaera sp.]